MDRRRKRRNKTMMTENGTHEMDEEKKYITYLIRLYVTLPETPSRATSYDHDVASSWFANGTPISIAESALILGFVRRLRRKPNGFPLPPIRTLSYFLPVIEELRQYPPNPSYIDYCREQLDSIRGLYPKLNR
jgi:hypothetical protein